MTKKKGLGRGLGALIEDMDPNQAGAPLEVPVDALEANPMQPRAGMRAREIKALAESIKDKGVLEPLVVRRVDLDRYELIAGERRLLAARQAGLETVPVVVREAGRAEMLELALVENLHREDLNPIEEAEAYQRLADEFSRTHEEMARLSGRDRTTVTNLLRLLQLPAGVQDDVRHGRLSTGHARALLSLGDPDRILAVREQVLGRDLSVRETEALVKKLAHPPARKKPAAREEVYYQALGDEVTRVLGAKSRIVRRGRGGRLVVNFASTEELERLLKVLGVKPV